MGSYRLDFGARWRIDFADDVRARLRARVVGGDDPSMNVLELLGMVLTAWTFVVQSAAVTEFPCRSLWLRGDNTSAVPWCNKCRGSREPRFGSHVRILGCLEIRSD